MPAQHSGIFVTLQPNFVKINLRHVVSHPLMATFCFQTSTAYRIAMLMAQYLC